MTELFEDLARAGPPRALRGGLWARRIVVLVLTLVVALALLDVFGQRESRSAATGTAATLSLDAPATVRGGLLFQARFTIAARKAIEHPRLVLGEGWVEGLQISSISPEPESQTSRDGALVLSYPALAAGHHSTIWVQFQVDPTNVGRRSFDLELDDAEQPLTRLDRSLTVLP
jgi:hypothetical protein